MSAVKTTKAPGVNIHAIKAIYAFEMHRTFRTLFQSVLAPVISTVLYVVVFGAALGKTMPGYGSFIVPGVMMMTVLTQSIANASFGIYFPRFVGTIYELLSAPVSTFETVTAYVGAAATKSIMLGLIILGTAMLLVPVPIQHPLGMIGLLVLSAVSFSLFGFILGIWADGFEKLQIVPLLIITPLTFLGGTFYKISNLPGVWRQVAQFNPVVYLISIFRWSFSDSADVPVVNSLAAIAVFFVACLLVVWIIFKTGWRLKT
jgi:ABC-2 type transport system permease protein